MKKLLLILLFLPMIGFGQSNNKSWLGDGLGEYFETNGNPKSKGLEFKIKIPLGYESNGEGKKEETVQLFKSSSGILLMLQVVNLANDPRYFQFLELSEEDRKRKVKNNLVSSSEAIYCEIKDYPSAITNLWLKDKKISHLSTFTIVKEYRLSITFMSNYILGENDMEFCKEMLNTIEFY